MFSRKQNPNIVSGNDGGNAAQAQQVQQAQLPPLPYGLGVLPAYFAPTTTTLMMRERLFSIAGNEFDIRTAEGMPVFRISGSVFSFSRRKQVMNMQGNLLFTLRHQNFSIPPSYYAEDPSGNEFLRVDGQWSFGRDKSRITFHNASSNQMVELKMSGDFFDVYSDIYYNDMIVARIDRQIFSLRSIFGGAYTYSGMDMAVIIALCCALDERKNNNQ